MEFLADRRGRDERGCFFESWNKMAIESALGIDAEFVQDNHSRSSHGTLRGLHAQSPVAQGKLGVKSGSGFYDYGGRSPEEIMKERDVKLIKLREFLRELGELA